ncbi:MAG: FAD-dependent oxidoreductase [Planctomycetaceae bacterium]
MRTIIATISIALFIASHACGAEIAPPRKDEHYDVVIYGGTSAGVAAAVQVRRLGKTVLLIEPRGHLGGLTISGLGMTDSGNKSVIGGISREFYQRVKRKYDDPANWKWQQPDQFRGYAPDSDAQWTFEPHIAEAVFAEMLDEAEVPALKRIQVMQLSKSDTGAISGLFLSDGRVVTGGAYIDATYEGDLMAMAGVTTTVGREANATYGETLNGIQTARAVSHQFTHQVDPYITPGDPSSGLLPGINKTPGGADGTADGLLQAYNYRLCITDVKENQRPFEKPVGYDERDHELLLRNFEAGDMRLPLAISMMPNRKTDVNNNFAVSTDWIGMNHDYAEANASDRAAFEARLKTYTHGLMWTLANHPRVPEKIRNEVSRWGWAKDEWQGPDWWNYWPYVREARRMVSDYVHTELDCRRLRDCPDPVGMGSYNMDSHHCQRYVTAEGFVRNEGDVQVSPGGPYLVSYRAIVPRKSECPNLLVPVCLSARTSRMARSAWSRSS